VSYDDYAGANDQWPVAVDDDVDVDDSNTPTPLPSSTDVTSAHTLVRCWLEAVSSRFAETRFAETRFAETRFAEIRVRG